MDITTSILFKALSPFQKLIFAAGGWIAGLVILIVKPEKLSGKILAYRSGASVISLPLTMMIDYKFVLDKWTVCGLALGLSYFGWLVLDIAEKKLPTYLEKKIDNNT